MYIYIHMLWLYNLPWSLGILIYIYICVHIYIHIWVFYVWIESAKAIPGSMQASQWLDECSTLVQPTAGTRMTLHMRL